MGRARRDFISCHGFKKKPLVQITVSSYRQSMIVRINIYNIINIYIFII